MSIVSGVGAPRTVGGSSGGYVIALNNLTTTPQTILNPDPQLAQLVIHNPGAVDVFVAPLVVQNGGSDSPLTPSTAALGGCFRVYANGGQLVLTGEIGKGWQAFAASGTNNPLTVMPSHSS